MLQKADEEIVFQIQNGDAESFGILVERYEEKLKRYARKFLFGYTDAQDLVQEVFIKAYINIKSFDTQRRFSPWLYRIAHNEFINAIKKRQREPISFFDTDTFFPHLLSKNYADDAINKRDVRKMLDRSLEQLTPKYREPLVLYYFEEMDYQEIADILRLPQSTVGVRLRRGRQLLEKIIQKPDI